MHVTKITVDTFVFLPAEQNRRVSRFWRIYN